MARPVKSTPPARSPTIGMMISLTKELTMAVKAPPTATPTARSTTEPRLINSMNSLRKLEPLEWALCKVSLALDVLVVLVVSDDDILLLSIVFPKNYQICGRGYLNFGMSHLRWNIGRLRWTS